jgi:hypothetical protein
VRIANPELRVSQSEPLIVTQDKPFIIAQPDPLKVETGELTVKVKQPFPSVTNGVAANTKTAEGDVIRREVTVFSNVRHGSGSVVTGWSYRDGSGGLPVQQYCYYTTPNVDHSSKRVDIASNRIRSPNIDSGVVPDLEGALAKCQWWHVNCKSTLLSAPTGPPPDHTIRGRKHAIATGAGNSIPLQPDCLTYARNPTSRNEPASPISAGGTCRVAWRSHQALKRRRPVTTFGLVHGIAPFFRILARQEFASKRLSRRRSSRLLLLDATCGVAERDRVPSGQNLTLESRRSGGDAIDRTSGFGPEVNCENRP